MPIGRSNVEEIKARLPIEDVIGQYVKLEKAGKSFKAKCPFHHEKTASFFVSPDRGGYYCFGCGAKGDIFSFVEQFEGLDFKGALKVLAERAGVQLVFDQKADSDRDRLFQITEEAAKYFEAQFSSSKEAQEYVKKRGMHDKTRQEFRIGWAPEAWHNLYDHLRGKKWPNELIEKAGLAKRADDNTGNYYDRFRGRVIFPLSDSSGRVIAFSGRILPRLDDGKAGKYLNSPDTPLFDKSSVLYGLDKAKNYIRKLDYSILVEGQMDLIMSHQAGIKNTVASSGTALNSGSVSNDINITSNLNLVRRLSSNIILAFDSDKAGRTATMRAVAVTALSSGMAVKIADIKGGKDPADIILNDPGEWKKILVNTKHVVEFELDNVIKDTHDPHKLMGAVRMRVLPYLANMQGEMDKAYYVNLISIKIHISEQSIWEELRKIEKDIRNKENNKITSNDSVESSEVSSKSRLDLVERRMIGLLTLMEKAGAPKSAEYRNTIANIAQGSFEQMIERTKPLMGDLSFEAEAFYGAEPERWDIHMAELISNFEIDMINAELVGSMNALRAAEKADDQATVAELAKKCQVLSLRKADVAKRAKEL